MDTLYKFLDAHSIFIVMIIVLIVWFGIFGFLFSLDRKLKGIEKELKNSESDNSELDLKEI